MQNISRKFALWVLLPVLLVSLFVVWLQASGFHQKPKAEVIDGVSFIERGRITLEHHAISELREMGVDYQYETGLEQLPASFVGTHPDFFWQLDNRGHLVVDNDVREIFDYFLAGLGEETLASLLARIHAYIDHTLEGPAAEEARALLENYIAMLNALSQWERARPPSSNQDIETMAERLQALRDMRVTYLDVAVAEAFYGEEERYDQYTLEQLAVLQNEALNDSQKADQITLLQADLPQGLRQSLQQAEQVIQLGKLTSEVQASGSEEDLYQIRASLVGDDAARRLAELDRVRAQWQMRMDSWLVERDELMASGALDESDIQNQLLERRAVHFTEQEIKRVIALESIARHQ